MTHTQRKTFINNSNNKANPLQNHCALAIAHYFSNPKDIYLHTLGDLKKHIESTHTLTVSKKFDNIKHMKNKFLKHTLHNNNILAYVIHTNGHVALLNPSGTPIIDTAPSHTEFNKIKYTLIIYKN